MKTNDFFTPTAIECIIHIEDCLKNAIDISSPLNKNTIMMVDIYHQIEVLLSQMESEND